MPRAGGPILKLAPTAEVDLLYDTLLALLMKFRRVGPGPSLFRRDHPGRQSARLVEIARGLLAEDSRHLWDGIAPPDPSLDSSIPF